MRWSCFIEAIARRILALLHTMYVDGGAIGDMGAAKGSGQAAVNVNVLCTEIGTPWADAKRQHMSETGTFLGVTHDVSRAFDKQGRVYFWPKAEMIDKLKCLLQEHRRRNEMTPAQASKLRCTLQWTTASMFNGIGTAAIAPLKQRQYRDHSPWTLSYALRRSIEYFDFILDLRPKREVVLRPDVAPLVVIASYTRADGSDPPSGGYLLFDGRSGDRVGGWCVFDDDLLTMWGFSPAHRAAGANPIALCESAMVPLVLAREWRRLQGRRVLWVLDNTSALHSFVKGRSEHATLDRNVSLMNFFKLRLDVTMWLEWVDSKSNWSDGISRRGVLPREGAVSFRARGVLPREFLARYMGEDKFAKTHGFHTEAMSVDAAAWCGALLDAWRWVQQCVAA